SLAVFDRISRKLKRFGDDNLFRALRWLIHDRCRIARDNRGPLDSPTQAAGVFIDGDQKRIRIVLIDGEDHLVIHKNRRRAEAVEHVEWSKRELPTLFPVLVIRDQPEFLKEDVDVLAVGDGAWRRGSVDELQAAAVSPRHIALPENLSRLAIETENLQLVVSLISSVRGNEDAAWREH